jgi:hypothetical protein
MTCYENVNKVMGLKAANAFWNPLYYDPSRRTLTKQLIFINERQIQAEIRALIWVAVATNRTVIIPNALAKDSIGSVDLYNGLALWPGFRLAYIRNGIKVDVVEPAFYWRVRRDYSGRDRSFVDRVPDPHVLRIPEGSSLAEIIGAVSPVQHSRLILQVLPKEVHGIEDSDGYRRLKAWADDSVGLWRSYRQELSEYGQLTSPSTSILYRGGKYSGKFFLENVRVCRKIFQPMRGNRSCFDKCD